MRAKSLHVLWESSLGDLTSKRRRSPVTGLGPMVGPALSWGQVFEQFPDFEECSLVFCIQADISHSAANIEESHHVPMQNDQLGNFRRLAFSE